MYDQKPKEFRIFRSYVENETSFETIPKLRQHNFVLFHTHPPHCFHMEVKVAVLNAISQSYNFFEVKQVPYASLCLGNYLDQKYCEILS